MNDSAPSRRGEEDEPVRAGARAGLAVNGVLHLLVAWLAIRVALGAAARADQAGALQTVAGEPFGRLLLWLVVAGFAGVVLWRAREALWGHRGIADDGKRRSKRLYAAGQVVVYTVLTALAIRVATGSPAGNGGQGLTAWLLRLPGGREAVVAIGMGVLVAGAVMAYRGWRLSFLDDVDLRSAGPTVRLVAVRAGQVGSVAKGVAIVIIGVLVGLSGLTYQPTRAEGLDAALKTLAGQPFGPVLLFAVALGLASYGVFSFFDARYHRV